MMRAQWLALRSWAEKLGWPGILGIALIVLAAVFYGWAVAPVAVEVADLRAAARATSKQGNVGDSVIGSKASVTEQLATFYAFFPRTDTSTEWIGKIYQAAKANGIVLQSGEYRFEQLNDQKLVRYQITLPVTGAYAQIREFVGAVLNEVPAVAVDEIQLRRDNVSSRALEARIRLSLYLAGA